MRWVRGPKFVLEFFKDVFKGQCIVEGLDAIFLETCMRGSHSHTGRTTMLYFILFKRSCDFVLVSA